VRHLLNINDQLKQIGVHIGLKGETALVFKRFLKFDIKEVFFNKIMSSMP
jgi:hypothetical protein